MQVDKLVAPSGMVLPLWLLVTILGLIIIVRIYFYFKSKNAENKTSEDGGGKS